MPYGHITLWHAARAAIDFLLAFQGQELAVSRVERPLDALLQLALASVSFMTFGCRENGLAAGCNADDSGPVRVINVGYFVMPTQLATRPGPAFQAANAARGFPNTTDINLSLGQYRQQLK